MAKKILLLLLAVLMLLFCLAWFNLPLRGLILLSVQRLGYQSRGWFAAPARTPEAAYSGFRKALQAGTGYTRYLSPKAQEYYGESLASPDKRAMILAWPEVMTQIYHLECEAFEACVETASYRLEYYQPDWEDDGKQIKGSQQRRELIFTKRKDGNWWISQL